MTTLHENVFSSNTSHHFEMKRKASFSKLTGALQRFYLTEKDGETADAKSKTNKLWQLMGNHQPSDVTSIQKAVVHHIEYSLSKNRFNFDDEACYRATSLSIRDRLLENFNDTNVFFFEKDVRRCYYLSLEFLIGRAMQNSLVNLDLEEQYSKALAELGFELENLYEYEHDAGLGNGGLGRLAACFLDSSATCNFPVWGYGIRYLYGTFEQKIWNGRQIEYPDYWLMNENPWEIPRSDITYGIRFGGEVKEYKDEKGRRRHKWVGGEIVQAQAYDNPVPGFDTYNCINLRLWRALPSREFDFQTFNKGNYREAVTERQKAELISAVLYPNDSTPQGKELRLRQQYFFVCATIQDVLRRFKKMPNRDWRDLPEKITMQLNDTHPTIAIPELMRVLVDVEGMDWDFAWSCCRQVFNYTNHTVLPEALEKWPAALLEKLLPRHLLIINEINFHFLNEIRDVFGDRPEVMKEVSIYEEGWQKSIRMANLAVIASHKVNGVAAIHTSIVIRDLFPHFVEFFKKGQQNKFVNITNGVTPRRWIHNANRPLSNLVSDTLGSDEWLKDLTLLQGIENYIDKEAFINQWKEVKCRNKVRLSKWVLHHCNVKLNPNTMMFDIQVKRIHEYKRQLLYCLYMIHRYLTIKAMSPEERKNVLPRAMMIGGKAAPGYEIAKTIIKLTNNIAQLVNNDNDVGDLMKVVFLPNYNVSAAQIVIPACDLSQQISTAGMEASGTGNMKFVMNGALIIGTLDGANVEIREEGGPETMFLFGAREDEVASIRSKARQGDYAVCEELQRVFDFVRCGQLSHGDGSAHSDFCALVDKLSSNGNGENGDYYLVCHDFPDYIRANNEAEATYKNEEKWWRLSVTAAAHMGKFTTDRCINEYAKEVWNLKPCERPAPKMSGASNSSTTTKTASSTAGASPSGRAATGSPGTAPAKVGAQSPKTNDNMESKQALSAKPTK